MSGKTRDVEYSEEVEAILDFNKKGELVGIDFPSSFSSGEKQK